MRGFCLRRCGVNRFCLRGAFCFGTGDSGGHRGFAFVVVGGRGLAVGIHHLGGAEIGICLDRFFRFGTGHGRRDCGFTGIIRAGVRRGSRRGGVRFSGFTGFNAGEGGRDGSFARVGVMVLFIFRLRRLIHRDLRLYGGPAGAALGTFRLTHGLIQRLRGFLRRDPCHCGLHVIILAVVEPHGGLFMTCFTGQFLPFHPRLFGFETRFGVSRARRFLIQLADFRLLLPVVLHQRNVARADVGAGTALNAVKQVVVARLLMLLAAAEPVKLLRQQTGRAGISTLAAPDTGLFLLRLAHFALRRGQQTVGDFHRRHVEVRQGEAHQRPAHNHQLLIVRAETGIVQ